jgi:hypothetical protein
MQMFRHVGSTILHGQPEPRMDCAMRAKRLFTHNPFSFESLTLMAKSILIKNPQNGLLKNGVYGFSWTYLFFGGLVPLFRGEIAIAILHIILSIMTLGISNIIFAFIYNRQYMQRQITQGFKLADRPEVNAACAVAIKADLALVSLPA